MKVYRSANEIFNISPISYVSAADIFNDSIRNDSIFSKVGDKLKDFAKDLSKKLADTEDRSGWAYRFDIKQHGRTPIHGSTSLKSIGYDYDKHEMEVEFQSGHIYRYDCEDTEIQDILDAESRGQYFYYHERLKHPYHRVR